VTEDTGLAQARIRALRLLYATIEWNVVTVAVALPAALAAGSIALLGFGLDTCVEIGASVVALLAVRGSGGRPWHARAIAGAFVLIGLYLGAQSILALVTHREPQPSPVGIVLLAITVVVMSSLAYLKARNSRALGNRVASAEARVTLIDSADSALVLAALVANAAFGLWWADPLGGLILAAYSLWEAWENHEASVGSAEQLPSSSR
jgi:divalent metal cation (Fe/Co/Zn/Cd) transporter